MWNVNKSLWRTMSFRDIVTKSGVNTIDIDFAKFVKMLSENGFVCLRQNGSHHVFADRNGNTIIANNHLNKMVARRIVKENKLNPGKLAGTLRL